MSDSWDDYADGWDSNADVILYSEKAYDALCEILNPEGLTILDFGCGTGLLTERLAHSAQRVVALDTSEKMIAALENKQLSNVDTLCAELFEESIKSSVSLNSKFDLIVASSVCAFLPDYEGALRLLKTLLKPGGIFVQWDWVNSGEDADFGFTEEMIEAAFINASLEISSITKAFSLESKNSSMPVLMGVAKNT